MVLINFDIKQVLTPLPFAIINLLCRIFKVKILVEKK